MSANPVRDQGAIIGARIAEGYEGLGGYNPGTKRYYPYQGKADKEGVWTIGRGHVLSAAEKNPAHKFWKGLTLAEVDALYVQDMSVRIGRLDAFLGGKYTAQEFGACLSLFYNYELAFHPGHSAGDAHRSGNKKATAQAFLLYIVSKKKRQLGLWRRRMSEALCYLTGKIMIAKTDAEEKALEAELRKHITFKRPVFK
jgi:GH24 family phage-related lysozyme (muramidase)